MNGKVQFERLHVDMFTLVSQPVIDRFLQIKDNNTFVYLGPIKEQPKKSEDEDEDEDEDTGSLEKKKPD